MRKERKHYTSEEKVAILRRHLLDHVPVSDLCEELGLQPTVFYRWQKEFFENGAGTSQGEVSGSQAADHLRQRAGSRHCRDATMLRDNLVGSSSRWLTARELIALALCTGKPKSSSDDRPQCLKNPRPEGAESYTNGERRFSISR